MGRDLTPGTIIRSYDENHGQGRAVVVAADGHDRRLTPEEAAALLAAEAASDHGQDPALLTRLLDGRLTSTWRRVTAEEVADETHECWNLGGCDPGGWCSEGHGDKVVVLHLGDDEVHTAYDEPAGVGGRDG